MNNKEKFTLQDFLIELEQINYQEIIDIIGPLIIYYINHKIIDTYTLHRDYKPKNIKKVNLPPELKEEYNQIDINNLVSSKLKDSFIQFSNIMIENFEKKDLINFYNNINTLKTSHSSFLLSGNVVGTYDTKQNKIVINENDFSKSIFHELLHMASATYKNGIRYCGFHQSSLKPRIASLGKGINEGYTELLGRRYFIDDSNCVVHMNMKFG